MFSLLLGGGGDREEHKLRLAVVQPVIKPIKNKAGKEKAKKALQKARIQVQFLETGNADLPVFSQATDSEEIWNRQLKRKQNSQVEGRSGDPEFEVSVADQQKSDTGTDSPAKLQSPSPVYSLLDVYEDHNIMDRNMNMILNKIRLISIKRHKDGDIFETFGNGWTLEPFDRRQSEDQNPRQLVLHRFGTPPSPEGFQTLIKQARKKEIFEYIDGLHAATEEEVMTQLKRCNLSRILSTNFLERKLSYNYVLINGGKGPIVWRMW